MSSFRARIFWSIARAVALANQPDSGSGNCQGDFKSVVEKSASANLLRFTLSVVFSERIKEPIR